MTVKFEVAKALVDIEHQFGLVKAGTCGGQHYEWTAWSGGKPLIVYHFYWQLGTEIEPRWEEGEAKYRVRIHGDRSPSCARRAVARGRSCPGGCRLRCRVAPPSPRQGAHCLREPRRS